MKVISFCLDQAECEDKTDKELKAQPIFDEDSNPKHSRRVMTTLVDIPDHVIAFISDMISDMKDFVRFGVVCRQWHSIYLHNLHRHNSSPHLPYLLVPAPKHENDQQTRRLYCLQENRIVPNIKLQVPHDEHCRGSSHGWLVTLNHNKVDIRLFNPFLSTNNVIHLPPLTSFPEVVPDDEFFFFRAVLSKSPELTSNYAVFVIYGRFSRLGFWKPGDTTWSHLGFDHQVIDDVIYYENKFYAIAHDGTLYACDVNHPNPKLEILAPPHEDYNYNEEKYLVDFCGTLLQIRRFTTWHEDDSRDTSVVKVCQLNPSNSTWSPVKELGDYALFLGDNHSMCLSTSSFPCCKPNCIYFTDDDKMFFRQDNPPHDLGVFNLQDGSFQPHYVEDSKFIVPAPIWIEPTLQAPNLQNSNSF